MRVEASASATNPYRFVFEGPPEIDVVRTAYIEYSYNLDMEGRSDEVTTFDRAVSDWPRDDPIKRVVTMRQALITARPGLVISKLYELHDNTEAVVEDMVEFIDGVADPEQVKTRMAGVEWRQNIGERALALAQSADLKLSAYVAENMSEMDLNAEFERILRPDQQES